jgi:hypothetical protein
MVTKPLDAFEQWFRITGTWWVEDAHMNNPIIHVQGDVKLKWSVTLIPDVRMPYTFGEVSGDFDCHSQNIKDLTGSPTKVGGNYYASWNPITSLKGGPKWVGGNYSVPECGPLTDMRDMADHVGGEFQVAWHPKLQLLKPFMNSSRVILTRASFTSWEQMDVMKQVQDILDDHAGEGRAGAIKVASKLVRMGLKDSARM